MIPSFPRLRRAPSRPSDPRPPAYPFASLVIVALAVVCSIALNPAAWPASPARSVLSGQWLLDGGFRADQPHLGFRVRTEHGQSSWGRNVASDRLEGLPPNALDHDAANVTFRVVRDAGTFECRGSIARGHGAGTFDLSLDPDFPGELERRGVGRPTEAQQIELACADAGLVLLDALNATGYPKPNVEEFVTLANHGVSIGYVHGLAKAGYKLGTLDRLVQARDHGVDADFVRGLDREGFKGLDFEVVMRARDHGVDPDFIHEMRAMGAPNATLDEFTALRDHGVTPDYVGDMRDAGYGRESLEALRVARDHGVDGRYAAALAEAGFGSLPLHKVVAARDHGVTVAFARRARAKLGRDTTIEDVIDWRDRGGR